MNFLNLKPGSIIRHECKCCHIIHIEIPEGAKPWMQDQNVMAWDFKCDCGSNMYVKNYDSLDEKLWNQVS